MKRPSFQFYPSDWLRDTALRSCSTGARGLWMDMICFMHEGKPYGHLKVGDKVILPSNLSRMVGETLDVVEGWLDELSQAGVYEINEEGAIYSKRMIRDENLRQTRAAGGSKGGNPLLKDKSKVNLEDKQKSTPSSTSTSASTSSNQSNKYVNTVDRAAIVSMYHESLPELPAVRMISAKRKKAIDSFYKFVMTSCRMDGSRRAETHDEAMAWIDEYFKRASRNDFLMCRKVGQDWMADFDFLLTEKGKVHVIEKTKDEQ